MSISPDKKRETRYCDCGELLEVSRSYAAEQDPNELEGCEDTTEVIKLADGTLLLLWPMDDGWYQGRKVHPDRLRLQEDERTDSKPAGPSHAS